MGDVWHRSTCWQNEILANFLGISPVRRPLKRSPDFRCREAGGREDEEGEMKGKTPTATSVTIFVVTFYLIHFAGTKNCANKKQHRQCCRLESDASCPENEIISGVKRFKSFATAAPAASPPLHPSSPRPPLPLAVAQLLAARPASVVAFNK